MENLSILRVTKMQSDQRALVQVRHGALKGDNYLGRQQNFNLMITKLIFKY